MTVSSKVREVLKISKTKFYSCPVSTVTGRTWQILGQVNEITNAEGDILPCAGLLSDIPMFLRDAVKIVKQERNRHRAEQMEKQRGR